jgi:hypothetical protein
MAEPCWYEIIPLLFGRARIIRTNGVQVFAGW